MSNATRRTGTTDLGATVILKTKGWGERARESTFKYLQTRVRFWIVVISVAAVAIAIAIPQAGLFGSLETWFQDELQHARIRSYDTAIRFPQSALVEFADRPEKISGTDAIRRGDPEWPRVWDVVIVTMDERAIRELDGTPFTPTENARVIETLAGLGAQVIAFDMLLSERREKHFPDPPGQTPLFEAIKSAREKNVRVIFGSKLDVRDDAQAAASEVRRDVADTAARQLLVPIPEIVEVADHGLINMPVNRGEMVRGYQFRFSEGPSLALATYLAKTFPHMPLDQAFAAGFARSPHVYDNPLLRESFLGESPQSRLLNFYGLPGQPFVHLSYVDVYRAHALIRVRQLVAAQAAAARILDDPTFRTDWAVLHVLVPDDIGPLPTLSDLRPEAVALLDDALLSLMERPEIHEAADGMRALDNVIAAAGPLFDEAEFYWTTVAGAAEELQAERRRLVASVSRQTERVAEVMSAIDPDTDSRGFQMSPERLAPPHLGTQREWIETALKAPIDDVQRAFLERLRLDLQALAFLDRQITRIAQFPIPPDPEEQRLQQIVRNKAVLVGPWTLDSQDLWNTPVAGDTIGTSRMYGVELHATALQNLFDMMRADSPVQVQRGIQPPTSAQIIGTVALVTIVTCLVTMFLNPLASAGVLGFGMWVYWLHAVRVFAVEWQFVPIVFPAIGIVLGYVMVTVTKVLTVDQERRLIEDLFKNYMDRRFVEILKDDPEKVKLGGERRDITVFFSDIAGFSGIAEKLSPEELILLINEYLGAMTDILLRYDATIDKYMGDAIMAFWNAPVDIDDHAAKACWAALEQREKLRDLQQAWRTRNLPSVDCRVGINTGNIVHGNMGSDLKKNYTLMGDDVNLAARFEPLNKDFGTHMIIGHRTFMLAQPKIEARRLGKVQVKGRHAPSDFYELIARKGELTDAQTELLGIFSDALTLYDDGRFDAARAGFRAALAVVPTDRASQVYERLCTQYLLDPPNMAHWNGTYVQTEK